MTPPDAPWPKREDYDIADDAGSPCSVFEAYECARAEVALAKLREAVEMLNTLAAQHSGKIGSTALADCMAIMAKLAVERIGEVPHD